MDQLGSRRFARCPLRSFSRACAARDHEGTRPAVLTSRLWNLCLTAPLWNLCGSLPLTWRGDAIGGTIVKVSRHEIDFKMARPRSAPSHQCRRLGTPKTSPLQPLNPL